MMNQIWRLKKQEIRKARPKWQEGSWFHPLTWGAQRRRSKERLRMETRFGVG